MRIVGAAIAATVMLALASGCGFRTLKRNDPRNLDGLNTTPI